MAFLEKDTVLGCDVFYKMNPECKKYTLRDNGFVEKTSGNFQLLRPIDATPQNKQGLQVKVMVYKDLKLIKMSITSEQGLKAINIFSNDNFEMNREKFFFVMDGLISRGVLEIA